MHKVLSTHHANNVISLGVAPGNPDIVVAGTLNAPDPLNLYRSPDGAVSWSAVGTDLPPNLSIAGVAFDPQNPNIVMAGDAALGLILRSGNGVKVGNHYQESQISSVPIVLSAKFMLCRKGPLQSFMQRLALMAYCAALIAAFAGRS